MFDIVLLVGSIVVKFVGLLKHSEIALIPSSSARKQHVCNSVA
jgi:hypothetical protein